jgi:ribosomal-protein-alanine N-acetyltransferase
MRMMSFQPDLESEGRYPTWEVGLQGFGPCASVSTDWRAGLPVLRGTRLTLRELRVEDAPALFEHVTPADVARFISPAPASVEAFEEFIRWTHRGRAIGQRACFAVVPEGHTSPVGLFQIRVLDAGQQSAEWGFALGSAYWGSGLFLAGARLAIDFAFGPMGLRRLEARACVINERGSGALRKVGAVREATLHQSYECQGERLDQGLWTIVREDAMFLRAASPSALVH